MNDLFPGFFGNDQGFNFDFGNFNNFDFNNKNGQTKSYSVQNVSF